ncbi:hypothetical protein M406DRAFT_60636 [Cryphonectria parasitica EP155]|uniref:Uncharacterized protein n=1 Tax=Cryphonectria parasitica (strain ATCC 38755 / EP155) TaxID=660469 RepID=A0A9P4Y3T8_CRYP1|nr:uncharacterized protein M406DRAFT_60636 [Cryphonectria parasitica EP155]KAF3766183.1 hypothetical protein M406DRAFT_60636 [Cryphonectria parasitica EP155]
MFGRILLTVDSLGLIFGAWLADYNSESHIFNPRWPPHAKFHCGQTIGLSTALGVATLFLAWRPLLVRSTSPAVARDSLKMAAFTGSVYWLAGLAAILFPGTDGLDPEFGGLVGSWLG